MSSGKVHVDYGKAPTVSELIEKSRSGMIAAWVVGGVFVVLTLVFHRMLAVQILNCPPSKKRALYLKITRMSPIFAITGYLGLWIVRANPLFEMVRAVYEAFAMGWFMRIIFLTFGNTKSEIQAKILNQPPSKFMSVPPFCCIFKPCVSEHNFTSFHLKLCVFGVKQFIVFRVIYIMLQLLLALENRGAMSESLEHKGNVMGVLAVLMQVSLWFALWCLFMVYKATHESLKQYNTTLKFVVFKLLLILSIVQSWIFSLVLERGHINNPSVFPVEILAVGWQNFLLCIEAFLCTLLCHKAYPASELKDDEHKLINSEDPDETNDIERDLQIFDIKF
eukprot:GFYU01041565.1.p1 GENE.GFYU01041565.1~~GFYU01041565.1.p1  ORF type:complete len:335 (-),score=70.70 GFYU01041565.1:108-1112(-)